MVILRDLLIGPKRFNELRQAIPGIPSNLLTSRLRDLEEADVVERSLDGRHMVYRLSTYGQDLGPILLDLGRWGSRRMSQPRDNEVPTDNSLAAALLTSRTTTRVRSFTIQVTAGPAVAHARVTATGVSVAAGADQDADLRIGGPGLRQLLATADADAAATAEDIEVEGDASLLPRFVRAFHAPLDDVVAERSAAAAS